MFRPAGWNGENGGRRQLHTYNFLISRVQTNPTNPTVTITQDPRTREVWAGFAQLNVPIFSDQNSLPGLRRLEFEASWRHDQYSDVGGTSNAKLAFNWNPIDDLTVRGGWGQSFRAPNFGEFSPIANVAWQGWNFGNSLQIITSNPERLLRSGPGAALRCSGAAKMFRRFRITRPKGEFHSTAASGSGWTPGAGLPISRSRSRSRTSAMFDGFDYRQPESHGPNLQATYYSSDTASCQFSNRGRQRFNDPSVASLSDAARSRSRTAGVGCGTDATPGCAPLPKL